MSDGVKPRRRYDSTRRRAQAEQTRHDVLTAAGELFLADGYAATTLAGIAQAAGVVVETVYRAFGSKAELFKAVVEAAVAGGAGRAEVPVEQRPAIQAVIAETDPRRRLERYADTQPGIHARLAPLYRALAAAAATDPALAAVARELEDGRRAGQAGLARLLAGNGELRPRLDVEEAADLIWALASPAVHELLVGQRGWTPERYRDWLAGALADALLPRSAVTGT
jgi:AcrR family transcriptional regulator